MPDTITGVLLAAGAAAAGIIAVGLLCTKLCPVCDHMLTTSVKHCPYCLHEF